MPLLLMVMALTINVGVNGSWKVRAAMVARDVVWSARWPRSGAQTQPANWPNNASRSVAQGNSLTVLADSSIDQPVARGQTIGQVTVNRNLLDPTTGLQLGQSDIVRSMAMLAQALPPTRFDLKHPLLDNAWQYQRMGLGSNQQLREPVIYQFPQVSGDLNQAYVSSVVAIYSSPLQAQWMTLDRDPQILAFYGHYHDFHPRLHHFCSLDKQSIRQNQVQRLIDHIQGSTQPKIESVAQRMINFFTNMYRQMQQQQPQ